MRFVALALLLSACGGGSPATADGGADASADVHHAPKKLDASTADAGDEDDADAGWNRMTEHAGVVIDHIRLYAIYVLAPNDPVEDRDELLSWVVSSPDYWSVLSQYGVGYGVLAEARRSTSRIFSTTATSTTVWLALSRSARASKTSRRRSHRTTAACRTRTSSFCRARRTPTSATARADTRSAITITRRRSPTRSFVGAATAARRSRTSSPRWRPTPCRSRDGTNIDGHVVTDLWSNAAGACAPQ